jgi:hypothetical protein
MIEHLRSKLMALGLTTSTTKKKNFTQSVQEKCLAYLEPGYHTAKHQMQ